ncbi:P-loop containing nucleoside triphosphate hydrolase protein [Gongronella butleri]|nr:P-loop containing nucleoside triphosphate hydrolase protein [Gongronella butleri]
MAYFHVKDLGFQLPNGQWLFKDIQIQLNQGDRLVIQGPSGCGKSTLLKCLAQLLPFEHGVCYFQGQPCEAYGVPQWRTQIMYVPQQPATHPGSPLDFFRKVKAFDSQKKRNDFDDPLDIAMSWGITEDVFREDWDRLSGGEKQRCTLAIACGNDVSLISISIEPTASLDVETIERVEKTLLRTTCIWVSHDPKQRKRVSTKVLALKGRQRDAQSNGNGNDNGYTINME